jgi:hypothetical protein
MNQIKSYIALYVTSFLLALAITLYLNQTAYLEQDQNFRVRTTTISAVYYNGFLFLVPLVVKLLLLRIDKAGNYTRLFLWQYLIALANVIAVIFALLAQDMVKSAEENFAIDKNSDRYLVIALLKISAYLIFLLIILKSVVRIIRSKINSKTVHSL